MNTKFKLGRSIAQLVPFHRIQIQQQQSKDDGVITTKLIKIMMVIALGKIYCLSWSLDLELL